MLFVTYRSCTIVHFSYLVCHEKEMVMMSK